MYEGERKGNTWKPFATSGPTWQAIQIHVREQVVRMKSGSGQDLLAEHPVSYSGGARFESRPRDWASWLMCLVVSHSSEAVFGVMQYME
jgi:hypothetical protein